MDNKIEVDYELWEEMKRSINELNETNAWAEVDRACERASVVRAYFENHLRQETEKVMQMEIETRKAMAVQMEEEKTLMAEFDELLARRESRRARNVNRGLIADESYAQAAQQRPASSPDPFASGNPFMQSMGF